MRKVIEHNEISEARKSDIPTGEEVLTKIKEKIKNKTLTKYQTIKPERNMYGIEETKDAVIAICALGNAVAASLADDGKITLSDYPKFISPIISLPAAITGIGEVPKELNDLTEKEKLELIALVRDKLDVGDRAEEVTVRILNIIYEIKSFVDFIK